MLPYLDTFFTLTPSVWSNIGVDVCKFMSLMALFLSCVYTGRAIVKANVLARSDYDKVFRVGTRPVLAFMMKHLAFWNLAYKELVGVFVSQNLPNTSKGELGIFGLLVYRPIPSPTTIRVDYAFRKEIIYTKPFLSSHVRHIIL